GYWTSGADPASLRWSNGLYSLAGLEPGTVQGRVAGRSLIHAEDLKQFEEARGKLDGSIAEYRWNHPDGRVHWLRSRMRHLSGEGAEAIDFGVVQDVTNEREATLALQEKLGFIQKITSRVPGVVFQLRLKADGSYEFPYISDPVRDLYRGVTPEEVMQDASCTLRLHHPDDRAAFVASIRTSAQHLTPWSHEYRLRFDDGEVRWLMGQAMPEREADGAVLWNGFTTDVTLRKQAEERLRDSEARFRALTALSSDWYWEQDEEMRFVRFEGRAVGSTPVDRIGKTRWEVGALNMSEADWDAHRAVLRAHGTFRDLELQDVDARGRNYWMSVSGEPIFDLQGIFRGYRGIGRNVTGRKRAEDEIERLAFYDVLTGLPNRRLLMDRLQHALATSGRDSSPGALLFIDLDNFKDLNDTQGHDMGDQLLKQVAVRLGECVRDADTVARLGGDEFVVMLEKLGREPNEAAALAEGVGRKILSMLSRPYRMGDAEHHSTPSIGITLFHDHLLSIDELLKRADLAMYQAKAAGRNTLRFFDPEMQAVVAARASLESDLRQGLQRKELLLYYQPVVNEAGLMVGVEALARWQHPQRGMVLPGDFIPLAEQTGLILPLGQWVLEAACTQLVAWSTHPDTACLSVAVNVSVRQFRQADFASQLLALLQLSGANPCRLKLEITESLLLNDMEDAIQKMGELRSIGVSFSLDDFGTGYSSLAYLKQLPLEQLKIDQSFVRDVLTDPNDAAIAQTVLTLGQSLGLTVVAEGVETQAQHEFLLRHGCRVFQGYLFGRPVPVGQLVLNGIAKPGQAGS
ncbi:EAL domain-containing protein, partial [Rhodoferax sp.]|uniref:sensor domain-containing protein n=1 Tax=Rhodoferax sp. TaxID=50421 RepID=UPI0027183D39